MNYQNSCVTQFREGCSDAGAPWRGGSRPSENLQGCNRQRVYSRISDAQHHGVESSLSGPGASLQTLLQKVERRMLVMAGLVLPGKPDAAPAVEGLLPHEHQDLQDSFLEAIAYDGRGDIDPPEQSEDLGMVRCTRIDQGL